MSIRVSRETTSGYATYGIAGDENTGLHSSAADTISIMAGGSNILPPTTSGYRIPVWIPLAITGGASSSGVFASLANPFGATVQIVSAVLVISTQSSGASTLDIGVGANASTSNDGLIDGLSGATAGTYNNTNNGGTNGKAAQAWASTGYLNVAEASGNVDALVATLWVQVLVP